MNGLKWKHPYRNEDARRERLVRELAWATRTNWKPAGEGEGLEAIPEFLRRNTEAEGERI